MPRRGVELTEEQWARVKSHAATRRQTISQFLGDVVNEILPDGHVRPATKAYEEVKLYEVSIVEDTPGNRAAGAIPIPSQPGKASSIAFTPAPKPKGKK